MRWVAIALAALLVGLLTYGVVAENRRTGTSSIDSALADGKNPAAPTTRLPRVGGTPGTGSLDDYKGKFVLVNFWASWCKPCVEEMPLLQDLQTKIEKRGATVLGIASRTNSENSVKFMRRFSITYPNLIDGSGDTADDWGVYRMPESFLLDREGKIVAHAIGMIDRKWIEKNVMPRLDGK